MKTIEIVGKRWDYFWRKGEKLYLRDVSGACTVLRMLPAAPYGGPFVSTPLPLPEGDPVLIERVYLHVPPVRLSQKAAEEFRDTHGPQALREGREEVWEGVWRDGRPGFTKPNFVCCYPDDDDSKLRGWLTELQIPGMSLADFKADKDGHLSTKLYQEWADQEGVKLETMVADAQTYLNKIARAGNLNPNLPKGVDEQTLLVAVNFRALFAEIGPVYLEDLGKQEPTPDERRDMQQEIAALEKKSATKRLHAARSRAGKQNAKVQDKRDRFRIMAAVRRKLGKSGKDMSRHRAAREVAALCWFLKEENNVVDLSQAYTLKADDVKRIMGWKK